MGVKETIRVCLFCLAGVLLFSCGVNENRLAGASSPYLQQHADNPVDWYEWGDEALEKAKKENKPLLISVGYASCHWCHVMERESFMDTAVARLMNENFICIKVDREERPDIDDIYKNACQLLTGNSGWPLNAFALPDGKPFFAGTYYSKKSWTSLLEKIAQAYRHQYAKVELQANALTNGIARLEISLLNDEDKDAVLTKDFYQGYFDSLFQKLDTISGGLRGSPKFPMPSTLEFILQYAAITGEENALLLARNWLTRMALGGIYDQVGGGFARYSVDSLWKIPHFEKMLYDNGQLMSVYAHAYQLTQDPFFKNIVQGLAAFAERDLAAGNGGYYSSLNAETKEGEGAFYAWTYDELKSVAGSSASLLSEYYNVTPGGNWEKGKSLLYASHTPQAFALQHNLRPEETYNIISAARKNLLAQRNKREKPNTDNKILASWNALMLTGYLDAYAALSEPAYLDRALANARFIEQQLVQKEGQLKRSFNAGKSLPGFLEDYAFVAKAYIRLYQLTFDKHWLSLAQQLTDYAIRNFHDSQSGMFFNTEKKGKQLVVRKMALTDDAIPSANAVMAQVLHLLGQYFENEEYMAKASQMVSLMSKQMIASAPFYAQWGLLAGLYANGVHELVICGSDALARNLEMQKHYLPQNIYFGSTRDENLSLLKGKVVDNKTLIYACVNRTCKQPVETVEKALLQLKAAQVSAID